MTGNVTDPRKPGYPVRHAMPNVLDMIDSPYRDSQKKAGNAEPATSANVTTTYNGVGTR